MEQHAPHLAHQPCRDESERAVQVIIVDAHLLIREALQRVIGSFPQVSVYASLSQMHDGLATLKKGDVLILGCSMTVTECLESVKVAQQIQSSLGIVVIRQLLCPETTFPMIRGGVQGLLGEDASAKDLAQAIAAVATGSTFLSQRAREILNGYVSHTPLYFTAREMQVMHCLRLGLSNYGIAQQLNLKEKTIEKYLTHIYEKLHIRSRTEAILRLQALHI
ncbi:MAG TPA: response regulator transcription factor [Ktedonosporobacter sp.]|nr:response regulator transcription factor [Ktedonosporobacter sp.]